MNVTKGFAAMSDRYRFDRMCSPSKGWAQLDTRQDASYYGNWVNPLTFELVSYCEGDITHTQCESSDEFVITLAETLAWHAERDYDPKIDGMCVPEIIENLKRLGFENWLH